MSIVPSILTCVLIENITHNIRIYARSAYISSISALKCTMGHRPVISRMCAPWCSNDASSDQFRNTSIDIPRRRSPSNMPSIAPLLSLITDYRLPITDSACLRGEKTPWLVRTICLYCSYQNKTPLPCKQRLTRVRASASWSKDPGT